MATFTATAELVNDRAELTTNFRSVPEIVEWVNHAFSALPGFVPQHAVRASRGTSEGAPDPVVVLHVEDDGPRQATTALSIAAWLRAGFDGDMTVVDPRTGGTRPVAPRDVMIVLPSWASADRIAEACDRYGIAATIEGGDRLFSRDEMRLALAALRAIVDGSDSEAVLFALRGLFGCTLTDLLAHERSGGSFRSRTLAPATTATRVDRTLDILARLARQTGSTPLSALVEELLWSTALPAWSVFADADRRRANLDRFYALLAAHERRARSPVEVVDAMTHEALREEHTDVPRLDDDGDAVRVTTLFSAKGLEAPIVVVAAQMRRYDATSAVIDRLQRTAALRIGALVPPGWDQAVQRERELDDAERRRWVYVACTRARDALVLAPPFDRLLAPDVRARGLPDPLADVPHGASAASPTGGPAVQVLHSGPLLSAAGERPPVWFVDAAGASLDHDVAAFLADPQPVEAVAATDESDAAIARARRSCRRWRTVSELAKNRRVVVDTLIEDGPSSASVGAVGGRIVHQVMERLDLRLDEERRVAAARALIEDLCAAAFVDDEMVARVSAVTERLTRHPVRARARAAVLAGRRAWREVPFAIPSEDRRRTTAGTIDVVFVDEDGARVVVVDWKSDIPAIGTALRARYEAQLSEYARAVAGALGAAMPVETVLAGPHATDCTRNCSSTKRT